MNTPPNTLKDNAKLGDGSIIELWAHTILHWEVVSLASDDTVHWSKEYHGDNAEAEAKAEYNRFAR